MGWLAQPNQNDLKKLLFVRILDTCRLANPCLCYPGGGYGGGDDEMEIQQDTIFIQGLGGGVTEPALADHFGSIGVLKVILSF